MAIRAPDGANKVNLFSRLLIIYHRFLKKTAFMTGIEYAFLFFTNSGCKSFFQQNYMKMLLLNVVHQSIVQPHLHCFYCFGKCVEQESLILPFTASPLLAYIQLSPSLLVIPVVGSAGQSPPAEPDKMKPFFPSMVGPIIQLEVPVRTVRYLSSLEEVFCRTCNQLTPLTKSIVDLFFYIFISNILSFWDVSLIEGEH